MIHNKIYYFIKPVLPYSLRIALRRKLGKIKSNSCRRIWPIQTSSGRIPEYWKGWPDGKKFSLILTHDIEGRYGISQCQSLAEMEMKMGFRSSFGFIPRGNYKVTKKLRDSLMEMGFEVALHDLYHDGKLYSSHDAFDEKAKIINRYLDEWKVSGFRSGLMHHNLEWLKKLNITYDSSTFDCDPFEPQSDGVETIFPFWVSRGDGTGFMELPTTLVQDFNLFIILKKDNIDIWKQKLDWIAERGGMVLLNTHPDYMYFEGNKKGRYQYPIKYYAEFLEYAKAHYEGTYWQGTPMQVAQYIGNKYENVYSNDEQKGAKARAKKANIKKIWIDLDNTPHVPFFEPIIAELKKRGYSVLITARDAFQVIDLADEKKMEFISIGRHYGKNRLAKIWGLAWRAMQLAPVIFPYAPDLAISHGARSQLLLCNLAKIKSILLADYEFSKIVPMAEPNWLIVPEAISDSAAGFNEERIRKYPGIKENVYVPYFKPDASLLSTLGLTEQNIIVTVRPPATEAHYHNPASDILFYDLMEKLIRNPQVRVILLPRNKSQQIELAKSKPEWFSEGKIVIPSKAIDGLNLIWNSDLVVSGGGTMNREAAALRVPVYSIFRGTIGAVDKYLVGEGRLTLIENIEDIDSKIRIEKRERSEQQSSTENKTLESIINHIEEILYPELTKQIS
jgi:uncharacterized protein